MSDYRFSGYRTTRHRDDRAQLRPPLRLLEDWTMNGVTAMPLIADGRLFVNLHEGAIVALAETDGSELWRHRSPTKHFGFSNGQFLLHGDRVLLYSHDHLTQLDAATGQVITCDATSELGLLLGMSDGVRLVCSMDGQSFGFGAYDPAARGVLWRREWPEAAKVAAMDGGLVAISRERDLVALDVATGEERWSHSFDALGDPGAVTIAEGQVFCSVTGHHVVSCDLATGEERWRHRLDVEVPGRPVYYLDGRLYCVWWKTMHVLDASTGELVARFDLGAEFAQRRAGPYFSAPSLTDDHLYVVGDGGRLLAIHKERGTVDWDFKLAGRTLLGNAPAIVGDRLYITDMASAGTGSLYVFEGA